MVRAWLNLPLPNTIRARLFFTWITNKEWFSGVMVLHGPGLVVPGVLNVLLDQDVSPVVHGGPAVHIPTQYIHVKIEFVAFDQ